MYEIRKEKRNPEKLQVLLSRIAEPLLTEAASTEDVSSHGMRVRTDRHWKRDTHLIVQSSEYLRSTSSGAAGESCTAKLFQTKLLQLDCSLRHGQGTGLCGHRYCESRWHP